MSKFKNVIVSIPTELLAEIDLRLWDPLRNKIRHGSRSALIVGLLREYLHAQAAKAKPFEHPAMKAGRTASLTPYPLKEPPTS